MRITLGEFQDNFILSNRVPLYARKSHRLPFYYCRCLQNCHSILYKKWFQPLSKGTSNCFTEPLFMDLHSML